VPVVAVPFSVGEDGYEDGKLVASSESHDSLGRNEECQNRTDQHRDSCYIFAHTK